MPSGSRLDEVIKTLGGQSPPVSGYLTYNPGPGIYSRLERAVEAMPENVRVQELPGLLKRYKEGVPGWELKATDLDATIAGRDVVPRDELLAAARERSPVYTHKEVVLGGAPQQSFQPEYYVGETPSLAGDMIADFQRRPSPLGQGVSHGVPRYRDYGQGGENYGELLLLQPNALGEQFGSHWHGQSGAPGVRAAVAHARFDTHGDALRINELQSDLGIHNRKRRENAASHVPAPGEARAPLPFPLEDAWADILIKRLALEAARGGHRAIEIASPRAIADKVGGNIDNYEHFYGKVVPGAIERLGRKMGGFADESSAIPASAGTTEGRWGPSRQRLRDEIDDYEMNAGLRDLSAVGSYRSLVDAFENDGAVYPEANRLYRLLIRNEGMLAEEAAERMPELMSLAQRQARATADFRVHNHNGIQYGAARTAPPGRRYIMSDEMRKRILTEGIPAAIAIGIGTDQVLGRLDGQSPQQQMR